MNPTFLNFTSFKKQGKFVRNMSEIYPKIEKSTDYQWVLSGWQIDSAPLSPNKTLSLLRMEPLGILRVAGPPLP